MQKKRLSLSPLQLMQKFYHDYSRQKQISTNNQNISCKYSINKSNDTDKFTKFLNLHQKRQRGNSTTVSANLNQHFNKNIRTLSPSRYRTNQSQTSKRSYFKNSFTQSHPFLVSQHKIGPKQLQQIKHTKTQPMQAASNPFNYNFKLMTPTENRNSVHQAKQKMIKIKQYKKQRMDKIRYNYLVSNCYKSSQNNESNLQLSKGSKIRIRQLNTKQRIFPTVNDIIDQRL